MELKQLLAGVIAGATATITFYPLELLKTRMQVIQGSDKRYKDMLSAARSVLLSEGPQGLYKGLSPGLIASAGSWGGYFMLYENSKSRKLKIGQTNKLGVVDHLLSGFEAGIAMVFVFNPLWLIKTRMALQGALGSSAQYFGMQDAIRQIYKQEGYLGFYKGLIPALILTSHGAIQFAAYEQFKHICKTTGHGIDSNNDILSSWAGFGGGVSKIVAFTATYPYQVVKSRLQQGQMITKEPYNGVVDCVMKMIRNEGLKSFFRGIVPGTLKVIPSASLTFLVYEKMLKLLTNV